MTRHARCSRMQWQPPIARARPSPSAPRRASVPNLSSGPTLCRPPWPRRSAGSRLWPPTNPMVMGAAYVTRVMISDATGDLRRLHEHSRHQYEWSGRSATNRVRERVPGRGPARHGRPRGGRGDRARRSGCHRRPQHRGDHPAPGRGAGSAPGRERRSARATWPAPTRSCLTSRSGQSAWRAAPMAEMLLAEDDPAGAFDLVERLLPFNTMDPRVLDELMVLGARAAADLVQRASDDRDQAAVQRHREALTRLVKTRATLPGIAFQPSGPDDTVQAARGALFTAEAGRAEGVDDQMGLWREAVAACAAAGLGWEQQVVVVAARLRADASQAPRAPRQPSCCEGSTSTPSSRAPPRCRPASRSSPRARASR